MRNNSVNAVNTHLEQLKLTIKQAWLTLAMLPDPDARYRRALGGGWVLKIVQEARDAYGATPASWKGTPSPAEITEMEEIFDQLVWLRQAEGFEGEGSIKRIAAWAWGVPIWKIAQREHRCERTIHYRINNSIAKILLEFKGIDVKLKVINEPEQRPARIRGFAPPREEADQSGSTAEPGKVYIGGEGFRFHGEKYRSAYDDGVDNRGKRRG